MRDLSGQSEENLTRVDLHRVARAQSRRSLRHRHLLCAVGQSTISSGSMFFQVSLRAI